MNIALSARNRLIIELEFVQSLANPAYLSFLSQKGHFEDPKFIAYLHYLQYLRSPKYAALLTGPLKQRRARLIGQGGAMLGAAIRAPQRQSPLGLPQPDGGPSKVKAILRIRPFLPHEDPLAHNKRAIVKAEDSLTAKIANPRNPAELLSYQFDGCHGPDATQMAIFAQDVAPVVERVLAGYNAAIFAYGNTGAGKTHTMEGTSAAPGMIPLTVQYVLEMLVKKGKAGRGKGCLPAPPPEIRLSYLEIYKEKVYDLLAPNPIATDLPIREDINHRILIPDLTVSKVYSLAEFEKLWAKGVGNRRTAATKLNAHSSRSHSCLTISVQSGVEAGWAKLHLIDLAGSEDNRRTANAGERLVESGAINKSLFVLGQVVDSLNSGASRIPYRDSKLTRLLQDSLGGAAYSLIIANVAPTEAFHVETCSTLNFASKSRQIENNVKMVTAGSSATTSHPTRLARHDEKSSSSPATISSEDVSVTKRRKRPLPTDEENNPFTHSTTTSSGSLQTMILERRIEEKVAQKLREISKGTILSPLLKGDTRDLLLLSKKPGGRSPLGKVVRNIKEGRTASSEGEKPKRAKKPLADPLDPQVAQIMPMVEPEVLRIINYGTLKEIKELKEIGAKRAQSILEYRDAVREIKEISELVEAKVMTNKVLGKIILANALGHVDFVPVAQNTGTTAVSAAAGPIRHNPIIMSEDVDHFEAV